MDKQGISYSKFFILESYEGDFSIVKDKIFNKKLKVPTSDIYVPANPRMLSKFGVLRLLQAFTAFRERSEGKEMMEYKFLEMALEEIFPDKEKFTLRVGRTNIVFRRVPFRLGEGDN